MLHIGHVNVRSLTTYFDEFKDFILSVNFDIYGLSETWLSSTLDCNIYSIRGYDLIRNDRLGRGGGVGFYITSNLLNSIVILNDISIINNNLEQYWVIITVGRLKVAIGVIYRPPSGSYVDFIDELETSISSIFPEVDHIICMGDININLFSLNNNAVNLFTALLDEFSLAQLITEPTRITPHSETLIDVLITSNTEMCFEISVVDLHHVTDHRSVSCKLNIIGNTRCKSEIKSFRDFRNADVHGLTKALGEVDWFNFYTCGDINEKIRYFNQIIHSICNEFISIKTIKTRGTPSPWITDVIKTMIKFRNNAFSQYRRTKSTAHWNYYRSLRNLTTDAIRKEKKAYFEFKLKNHDRKNIFKTLTDFNILSKPDSNIPDSLCNVNLLNSHFVNSLPSSEPDTALLEFYNNNRLSHDSSLLTFSLILEEDISKIFYSLKSNATGVDNLNLKLIQFIFPAIVPQLTHIINECLIKSIVHFLIFGNRLWSNQLAKVKIRHLTMILDQSVFCLLYQKF